MTLPPVDVFVHVPKTGGSSLRHVLSRFYPPSRQLVFGGEVDEFDRFSRQPLPDPGWQLVQGHIPFGIHRVIGREGRYFTFLREPVARFVSDFKFALSPESGYHKSLPANPGLRDFIALDSGFLIDPHCKWIAGYHPLHAAGIDRREIFETARQRLVRDYVVFGITAHLDESLLLIARELGWDVPLYLRSNVSRPGKPVEIQPEDGDAIERMNAFDILLYDEALRLFRARLAAQGDSFTRALMAFRRLLSTHSARHPEYDEHATYVADRDGVLELADLDPEDMATVRTYLRS